ncbi:tetratricopeptide repeat protein [Sinomicrobium kalidii]|uniref:tetratricopeptide repeat protein n=1 Tax=Sinomicrobium kalidii TaxID=2900738 RepID=UPI001E2DDAF1|nr:tetratricopeptide repeat protein [Sinomicrobium kalidii]UGU18087.1 tetratricopeptide repeat protein [Sinomicrobium kalidii]
MNKLPFYILIILYFNTIHSQNNRIVAGKWPDTLTAPEKVSKNYLDAAFGHYKDGEYETFRMYNDSVIPVAEKFGLGKLEVKALINLGIYFSIMGEYKESLEQYHNALEKCESLPDGEETGIAVLVNIGNIYNNIGAHEKAIAAMEEVLARSERYQVSDFTKIAAYNGLGASYSSLGDKEKALSCLYKVKDLGEQTGNTEVLLTALDNIANAHFRKKEYGRAIETSLESLERSSKRRALTLLNLGMAYGKTGEPEKAVSYLEEGKATAILEKNKKLEMHFCLHLAKTYEALGYFKKSYKEQKQYAEMLEKNMQEKTDATKLDLKQEARLQHREMDQRLYAITTLNSKKNKLIAGGSLALLLLGGLLFFHIRKRKNLETDREKIRGNYLALSNENKALKTKMKDLAAKRREAHHGEPAAKISPQYKNSSLTGEDRKHYMNLILDHMEKEKPYLDFDITPSDLASTLSMSVHHLSEVLNLCFEQNFYSFINIYRVNESQKLMRNPAYNDYKILAIAYEAGFRSKTSFNRVFKNHTGFTPSQYRKNTV